MVGLTLGVSVTVGDVLGDFVGDGELALGEGLIVCPTWAGGGNDSTGFPSSAVVIISCQVAAAPDPNIGTPPSVTGLAGSALPYQTAVDSCGVKPTNQASKLSWP